MKVSMTQAAGLMVAVGFDKAKVAKMSKDAIAEKINKFHEVKSIKEAAKKIKDKDTKSLLEKLLEALNAGKSVSITDDPKAGGKKNAKPADEDEGDEESEDEDEGDEGEDEDEGDEDEGDEDEGDEESEDEDEDEGEGDEDEGEGDEDEGEGDEGEGDEGEGDEGEEEKPAPKKDKKDGKKDKKDGKKDSKKKDKKDGKKDAAPKNEFGHRLGTRAARIDAAITSEPKTMEQIKKDAKYTKPFHGHLRGLIEAGWVLKKEKDGETVYFRSKTAPKAKK